MTKTITVVMRVTMRVDEENEERILEPFIYSDEAESSEAALAMLEKLGFTVNEYDTEFTELDITYEVKE